MKKNLYKKIFVAGAALFLLFAPVGLIINRTTAQNTATGPYLLSLNLNTALAQTANQQPNLFTHPVTGAVYYVAYTVDNIMSLGVVLGAFLVRLGLQFNDNVFNSPAVTIGFSVSLAIANLGFVLGIIVIALATILRKQTYGIKQLLWKLVVMAILVNFGLVIMAPIVGFASSMSNYFIAATSPSSATGGYEGYVTTMAQAFAPQAVNVNIKNTNCTGAGATALCNLQNSNAQSISPPSSFTQSLLSLIFGIVFLALTAFTFLCLAVLLIIRYLMLGGLLIVLPLAWLTWIFPKFDNSFSKWWNTFLKWTFFPPLALFFIYLAFTTAANTGQNAYLQQAAGLPQNAASGAEGALVYQTGLAGPIQQAADEILLVGLTIMGLMFANSLAGKAGSTVVNGGVAASRAVGGYVGKQTKKGARAGFRAAGGNKAVEAMRSGQLGGLQKIPGLGRAASLAGRALEPHLTSVALVDAAKKKVPENMEQVKQNLKGSMNSEDRFAHLAKLIEKGELTRDTMVGSQTAGQFLDTHEKMVANYGFIKSSKDADKLLGNNKEMRGAQAEIEKAQTPEDTEGAKKKLSTETDKFVAKLEKGDISKMNVNDIFKKPDTSKGETENPFAVALAKSFATQAPQFAASAMPKMKATVLKQFEDTYKKVITEESKKSPKLQAIDGANAEIDALQEEKNTGNADIERLKDEIERVKNMKGDDSYKGEEIRKRNILISQKTKELNTNIKTAQARKKALEDSLSVEEKNLIFASKSFKASLNANATFGASEPTATPVPQPQESHI